MDELCYDKAHEYWRFSYSPEVVVGEVVVVVVGEVVVVVVGEVVVVVVFGEAVAGLLQETSQPFAPRPFFLLSLVNSTMKSEEEVNTKFLLLPQTLEKQIESWQADCIGEILHSLIIFICQHQGVSIAAILVIIDGYSLAGKSHLRAGLIQEVINQAPDIMTVLAPGRGFILKTIPCPDGNSRLRISGATGDIWEGLGLNWIITPPQDIPWAWAVDRKRKIKLPDSRVCMILMESNAEYTYIVRLSHLHICIFIIDSVVYKAM